MEYYATNERTLARTRWHPHSLYIYAHVNPKFLFDSIIRIDDRYTQRAALLLLARDFISPSRVRET